MPPDSSPADTALEGQTPDAQVADSSPATESGQSTLDVVRGVLGEKSETSPASAPDAQAAPAPKVEAPKASEPGAPAELSDAEIRQLHPKTQARIRYLNQQTKDLTAKASKFETRAQELDRVQDRIRETGLEPKDLDSGFEIMTAMKSGDYVKARDLLVPIMQDLLDRTGVSVSKELQAEVTAGKLSAEHARQLSEAKAQATNVAAMRERETQVRTQADQARDASAAHSAVVSSVNAWEQAKQKSDPDWSIKAPLVRQALRAAALEAGGLPNAQDALKMADDALKLVNAQIAHFRPKPAAIRAVTGGAANSGRAPGSEPKSTLDVIKQSLGH